jgi:hypothetical protein
MTKGSHDLAKTPWDTGLITEWAYHNRHYALMRQIVKSGDPIRLAVAYRLGLDRPESLVMTTATLLLRSHPNPLYPELIVISLTSNNFSKRALWRETRKPLRRSLLLELV